MEDYIVEVKGKRHKVRGYVESNGYVRLVIDGKKISAHRYIYSLHHGDIPEGYEIHHINGNKEDNRIENLALVTPTENKRKVDQAGRGYYFDKVKKKRRWRAVRDYDKKKYHIGHFGTECGAYMASRMFHVNKGLYYGKN